MIIMSLVCKCPSIIVILRCIHISNEPSKEGTVPQWFELGIEGLWNCGHKHFHDCYAQKPQYIKGQFYNFPPYLMMSRFLWEEFRSSQIGLSLCKHVCSSYSVWQFHSVVHFIREQILELSFEILGLWQKRWLNFDWFLPISPLLYLVYPFNQCTF